MRSRVTIVGFVFSCVCLHLTLIPEISYMIWRIDVTTFVCIISFQLKHADTRISIIEQTHTSSHISVETSFQ